MEFEEFLIKFCFQTGSRCWDCHGTLSDYDYVCDIEKQYFFLNRVDTRGAKITDCFEWYNTYDRTIKTIYEVNLDGKKYNIIFLTTNLVNAWRVATFTLDTLNELDPPSLKEKSTRVSIFDSIVCAYMEAREKREEYNKSL